ncbi:MAG TPA: hypothetical protein VF636_07135, partial [Sphingomonas sp.]
MFTDVSAEPTLHVLRPDAHQLAASSPTPKAHARWRPSSTALRVRSFALLVTIDMLCIVVGFVLAAALRGTLFDDDGWVRIVSLVTPLYLVVALNSHAFGAEVYDGPLRSVGKGVRALVVALGCTTLAAFYLKTSTSLPRLTVGLGWLFAVGFLGTARYFCMRHLPAIIGGNPYSCALIWEAGQPVPDTEFSITIAANEFLDPESDDPMMYDRLAKSLESVHNVVVSCRPERRAAWTHALKGANVQSEILMPELEVMA